jgi:hypothetical protein
MESRRTFREFENWSSSKSLSPHPVEINLLLSTKTYTMNRSEENCVANCVSNEKATNKFYLVSG